MIHASLALDKTLSVAPGYLVKTGYVAISDVVLDCRAQMAIGDVERAYERVKQNAPNQVFPCPIGRWGEDARFHLEDGRHAFVAHMMNGFTHILVAWTEKA